MEIQEVLKQLRKSKGLTQKELATKMNITQAGYGKIESGQVEISVSRLYRLAEIFNMKVEEILYYPNKVQNGSNERVEELEKRNEELEKRVEELEGDKYFMQQALKEKSNLLEHSNAKLNYEFSDPDGSFFLEEMKNILFKDYKYLPINNKDSVIPLQYIATKDQKNLLNQLIEHTKESLLDHPIIIHLKVSEYYKNLEEIKNTINFMSYSSFQLMDEKERASIKFYKQLAFYVEKILSMDESYSSIINLDSNLLIKPDLNQKQKRIFSEVLKQAVEYVINDLFNFDRFESYEDAKTRLNQTDIEFINEGYELLGEVNEFDDIRPFYEFHSHNIL